jgi:hypothetical protein
MPALHPTRAARAGSRRRWTTGAVIAATLLAEVPRAADPADHAADPVAACDRPDDDAPHRSHPAPVAPTDPPIERGAACDGPDIHGAVRPAGASHRPFLRHVIGP